MQLEHGRDRLPAAILLRVRREFVETATAGSDLAVTEFKYRYSASSPAAILWSAGVREAREAADAQARLNGAGFKTVDLSNMMAAQVRGCRVGIIEYV